MESALHFHCTYITAQLIHCNLPLTFADTYTYLSLHTHTLPPPHTHPPPPHTHPHTLTPSQVLLFDLGSAYWKLEEWRKDLWELSHIGIPEQDKESRDTIVFGFLTAWFIQEVRTLREMPSTRDGCVHSWWPCLAFGVF